MKALLLILMLIPLSSKAQGKYDLDYLVGACKTLDYPFLKLGIQGTVEDYLRGLDLRNATTADYQIPTLQELGFRIPGQGEHNWTRIQLPHLLLKKTAVTNYQHNSWRMFQHPNVNLNDTRTWPDFFAKYDPNTIPDISSIEKESWTKWIKTMKTGRVLNQGAFNLFLRFKHLVPIVACSQYIGDSKISVAQCQKSLLNIIREDAPSYVAVFLEETMERIFSDKSYRLPAIRASKRLIEMFNDSNIRTESHFNILLEEFLANGESRDSAIGKALDIFASLSVVGPDVFMIFLWDFAGQDNPIPPNDQAYMLALRVLGTVPPALDMRQFSVAQNFYVRSSALPESVSMNCQFGKYYYFWQTAYWMWKHGKNIKSNRGQNGVLASIWLLLKGYQKLSNGPYRVPYSNLAGPIDSVANNQIRRDLALGLSGMRFVKALINKQEPTISTDEMMLKLLNTARPVTIENFVEKNQKLYTCLNKPEFKCLNETKTILLEFEKKWEYTLNADVLLEEL